MPVSNANLDELATKLAALHINSPVRSNKTKRYAQKRSLKPFLKKNITKRGITVKEATRERSKALRRMKMYNTAKTRRAAKAAETRRLRREKNMEETSRILEHAATSGIGTRSRVRKEKVAMKE